MNTDNYFPKHQDIGLWRGWAGNGSISDGPINRAEQAKDYKPTPISELSAPAPHRFGKPRLTAVNANGREVELRLHPNPLNTERRYNRSNMTSETFEDYMNSRKANTISGHHRANTCSRFHQVK